MYRIRTVLGKDAYPTPTMKDEIDQKTEEAMRVYGAEMIHSMCKIMNLQVHAY
eukprot:gene9698-18708_t